MNLFFSKGLDVFLDHVEAVRRHLEKPSNWIDKTAVIGTGSKVWHYASVLAGAIVGENCSIGSGTEIGKGCRIGNGSRIGAHVFLPPNTVIEENVFISPGVVCCDDRFPVCNNNNYKAEPPYFESGCVIGAGCVILPGVRVGKGAFVAAGAIVTRDVAPHEHVRGEPARVKPYSRIQTDINYDIYAPAIRDRVVAGERVSEV